MELNTSDSPPEIPYIADMWQVISNSLMGKTVTSELLNSVLGGYISCGVSLLSGLYGAQPQIIVDKILRERATSDSKYIREAFVVFSDVDRQGTLTGGNALCEYIRKNNLGEIVELGPRKNPNSGNMIKIWMWAPPHESLEKEDRFMPRYGMNMRLNGYGDAVYTIKTDPRFGQNLNTREL